ncbi:unnamed protein product [Phaedon cochleariae]|uniref:Interference hedgehog n=1 Tax=Phaedon cochleariae TaxID=80249 RepID=A0A9P0GWV0_PHACE|nr:unnamed protein product [Phaedon cochleariae]
MEGAHIVAIAVLIMVVFMEFVSSDTMYMVSVPEPISLPIGFETMLTCEMDIEPDKFQWKFYPTDEPYNADAYIDLSNGTYELLPPHRSFASGRKKSALTLQVNGTSSAGDYQCLAYYGALAVASVPWRVTVAVLAAFPRQPPVDAVVAAGNTVLWRCLPPPASNPPAFVEYYKGEGEETVSAPYSEVKSLVLPNVSTKDSGVYTCKATNTMKYVSSSTRLNLQVVTYPPMRAPYFIVEPRKTYSVLKGDTVLLECAAIGNPVPKVIWFKKNAQLPSDRIEMLSGGLKIKNVSSTDDGTYFCNFTNAYGTASHRIELTYNEEPTIDCPTNETDPKQGEYLDLACSVKGVPAPRLSWFLNGFSVLNDSLVEVSGSRINFTRVEKRHAGNLQLFARNAAKTVYASIYVSVIPIASTDAAEQPSRPRHRPKHKPGSTRKPAKVAKTPKMIAPSRPAIARLTDESVAVRWTVPHDTGLPISFFKVQYRDLGPASSPESYNKSRWRTANEDIAPNLRDYHAANLLADHVYRFRIAAVYSNNDNKLSPNSERFHLKRLDFDARNPLPVPLITHTETVNTTAVRIHWKVTISTNISVDGFYISFMSASTAGDYMKATVDGENTREFVLSYLVPDTIYDIKLQSFNSKHASEFSPIMKARTEGNHSQSTTTAAPMLPPRGEKQEYSLYVIVAGAVIGCALLVCGITLVFVCRKWKQKKSVDNRDKSVDDHHIQVDGNEYVVGPKTIPKSNGCTPNRITITANPLADADNKNQNMIEMSCLTAQNNNCAAARQETSTGDRQEPPANSKDKKTKSKDKNKHKRLSAENVPPGENYV